MEFADGVAEIPAKSVMDEGADADGGLETPISAGFGDCFEQALTASNRPRIAKAAIMANFCWRDQDESSVPENVLLVSVLLIDFQIVAMLSPPCGGRSCQGEKQGGCQSRAA